MRPMGPTTEEDQRMSANCVFQRKEKKYLIHSGAMQIMLRECAGNMPGAPLQHYRIRSTYFDDENWQCYKAQIVKQVPRFKIRFRQYGNPGGFNPKGFLEMKMKDGAITKKRRFWICAPWLNALSDENTADGIVALNAGITSDALAETYQAITSHITFGSFQPVVQIEYQRVSLEDPQGKLRITFDTNLGFSATRPCRFVPRRERDGLPGDFVIMEVKSMEDAPDWLKETQRQLSVHPHAFSKYALAVSMIYEPLLPANEKAGSMTTVHFSTGVEYATAV